ncbi:hypothetical protein B0J12DRAFT_451428 [Macrophomina phaseolina]|uniref:Mg2+ transporter protein CorA-like/Zinc transport protein ZntB n=1 Tax=Macrophomina phaseolina TaxID=35725 RepID=A0ABQ8GFG4_9PEZI|nr:hypothetical protein B0J12DRAFT_451428 [Macrophomina phaseolina]
MAAFEQAIRAHTEFPDAIKLCNDFAAISKKPHRGVFSTLCTYRASKSPNSPLLAPEDCSWSQCLNYFWSAMSLNKHSDFELIVVFTQAPDIERTFSFVEKLAAFTHTRLQKLISIPRDLIVFAVAVQWDLSPSFAAEARSLLDLNDEPLARAWSPRFPSSNGGAEHGPLITTRHSFKFEYPTKGTLQEYVTDLHTYVFRPFGKVPKVEQLNVSVFEHQPLGVHKVLIVADAPQKDLRWLEDGLVGITNHSWEEQLLQIFSAIVPHVRTEYSNFLTKAWSDLTQTASDGRLYPSGSKVQHLLHLEDCRQRVLETCESNIRAVTNCLTYISTQLCFPLKQEHDIQVGSLRDFIADLEYLQVELTKLRAHIETAKRTTRDQLELAQVRRTSVLTVLAGLYIPLSFVSSFFGMNVSQFSGEPSVVMKNITNINPDNKNDTSQGEFQMITRDGDNQSFELKYFFAAAMPLTFFTILFPLIAGAIIRWCLQMVSRGGTWWRALIALSSLLLLELPGVLFLHAQAYGEETLSIGIERILIAASAFMIVTCCLISIVGLWNFTHAALRANWWAMMYWFFQTILVLAILFTAQLLQVLELSYRHRKLHMFISYGGGLICWLLYGLGWWLWPQWHYRWDERRVKKKSA